MKIKKYAVQEKDKEQGKSCKDDANKIQIYKGKIPALKLSNES